MGYTFSSPNDISLGSVTHNIGTGPFTMINWIYPTNLTDWRGVLQNGDFGANPGIYSAMGGANWGIWWDSQRNSGNTLSVNTLYCLGVRRIPVSNLVELFQNGSKTPTSHTIATSMPNAIMRYGQNGNGGARYIGDILHGACWNIALPDNDMEAIGNGADPLTIKPKNLIFSHEFNSNYASLPDRSGNGVTGTLNGVTYSTRQAPIRRRSLLKKRMMSMFGGAAPATRKIFTNYFPQPVI